MVVHVQYISDEKVIEGGYHYKLLVSAGFKFKQPYFFKQKRFGNFLLDMDSATYRRVPDRSTFYLIWNPSDFQLLEARIFFFKHDILFGSSGPGI